MELHNTVEDLVISRVDEYFRDLEKEGNPDHLCLCNYCKMDTICYALNRTSPYYIVSNRGASRVQGESLEQQQKVADIAALISEGVKRVNHNQRPNLTHATDADGATAISKHPVYNVPAIMGRIFNGGNFAPLSDVKVELLYNGELVSMKDENWPNPYSIVPNTEGNYSFWPAPDVASKADKHKIFEYTLRVTGPDFEPLIHFFKIPVASEIQTAGSFNLQRTFKLPDLYMFPPGEAEKNGYQD